MNNNQNLPGEAKPGMPHTQDLYNSRHGRDLFTDLQDYMDWTTWACAEMPQSVPVDHLSNNVGNTSGTGIGDRRGTFQYWTFMKYSSGEYILPAHMAQQEPENALLSDSSYTFGIYGWRTNHDDGTGIFWNGWSDNPSFMFYKGGVPRGINQIYAGGHGRWSSFNSMRPLSSADLSTFYGAKDSLTE